MEKRTLKPKPESMTLDGDTLVMERGGKKRRLRLQDAPELAASSTASAAPWRVTAPALERHYRLCLEGTADVWTLHLTPVDEKISRLVSRASALPALATKCAASKHCRPTATAHSCSSKELLPPDGGIHAARPECDSRLAGVFVRRRIHHQPHPVHHRSVGIFAP